ncbi:MAG: hypothetical protein IJ929_03195 [Prevotella sp.]|nr:hypothetical protein [Prevotella sp.]
MAIVQSYAGVTLTVPDVNIVPGGTSYVVINFDLGAQPYTAYQFDIAYPEGISSVNDNNNPKFQAGDIYDGHSVSSGYAPSGQARFQCFSSYSTPFTVQSGTLLILTIGAAKSMAEGTYQAVISPIEFVQTDATPDRPDAITFNIKVSKNVVLDESSTLAPVSAAGVNVRVKRSIKANEWSTICLPFAMNATQLKAAFGNDVQLGDFNGYETIEEGKDIIGITVNFNTVSAIEANHPYVIKVTSPITDFSVDGVDIDPTENLTVAAVERTKRQWSEMTGTYVANTVIEKNCLFLNSNKFYYSKGNTKMKAFRAYFDLYDVLSSVENATAPVYISVENSVTGISSTNRDIPENARIFDLQGRRINTPEKGLYIKGGKKMVVK